jgi:hypothetical protein
VAGVFASAARQATLGANRHVLIANDLAAQADAGQAARRKHVSLGNRHAFRLALDELDAACRTPRIPAAGVQLIDPGIMLERQNQPLPVRHFKLAHPIDCKFRHECDSLTAYLDR